LTEILVVGIINELHV